MHSNRRTVTVLRCGRAMHMATVRRVRWTLLLAGVAALFLVLAGGAAAVCAFADVNCGIRSSEEDASSTQLGDGFEQDVVLEGLQEPTDVSFLRDGRMLVAEKAGRVLLVDRQQRIQPRPLLDIRKQVNRWEFRGLITAEPDPDFDRNGFVYVLYVREHGSGAENAPRTMRLSRFTAKDGVASPDTERVLLGRRGAGSCLDLPATADCLPSEVDHNGGQIRFAADGTLFVSTGDGGGLDRFERTALRSQSVHALSGKILHITRTGRGLPGNPFWNGDPGANRSKVWATGFRNPYRMTLRPGSDTPYVGDVGQRKTEEVDVARRGANLGWPCYEGLARQPSFQDSALCRRLYRRGPAAVQQPLLSWGHDVGASATLGDFYTGSAFPRRYRGALMYGDFTGEWIRFVRLDGRDRVLDRGGFATDVASPATIRTAPDGSIYYLAYYRGELRRIRYAP
jgi:glucose/arabinose dehydrogenase